MHEERRRSLLTQDDKADLVEMLSEALEKQGRGTVDCGKWADHHKWLAAHIKRDDARAAFWDRLREHVVKWGAVSLITILFYLLWQGFKHYAK